MSYIVKNNSLFWEIFWNLQNCEAISYFRRASAKEKGEPDDALDSIALRGTFQELFPIRTFTMSKAP